MSHFSFKKVFILTTMFHLSINSLKHNFLQKSEFYSKLDDEDISDSDYQHAINVWNKFNCKTICDYHNLYLKSDVLLLSDVFENSEKLV